MKELDVFRLNKDFEDLKCGTEGTIVYEQGIGWFEVEFFDNNNDTIGVYTIKKDYLELIEEYN